MAQTPTETDGCRVDVYRLLSACLCEPERDLLVTEDVPRALARALAPLSPRAAAAANRMADVLEESSGDELRQAHAQLFVGPFELQVPPYGSVYLDGQRQLLGPSTADLIDLYRTEGLEVAAKAFELPDHIAVELEFLHYLTAREVASRRGGEIAEASRLAARRAAFVERFLRPWIDPFTSALCERAPVPFYRHLGECLAATIADLEAAPEPDGGRLAAHP